MSSLVPIEGIIVRCDPTTRIYLMKKNDEVDKSQQFILYHLGGDCIFIERNKEGYVRRLINEWIDTTSTPKKDEENVNQKRR